LRLGARKLDGILEQLDRELVGDGAGRGWWWYQTGCAGMKPSGKPMTRAPCAPASRMSRQAFAVEPSRSRKTEAACTAATRTTS